MPSWDEYVHKLIRAQIARQAGIDPLELRDRTKFSDIGLGDNERKAAVTAAGRQALRGYRPALDATIPAYLMWIHRFGKFASRVGDVIEADLAKILWLVTTDAAGAVRRPSDRLPAANTGRKRQFVAALEEKYEARTRAPGISQNERRQLRNAGTYGDARGVLLARELKRLPE